MRIATLTDLPALTALWSDCFGDSPTVIREFWDSLFHTCTVFTAAECGAMAIAMPVRWQNRDAAYLYAVCTAPHLRGQGVSRALLSEAEAYLTGQGNSYAVLVPAGESLFGFYGALGYETTFFCERQTFSGGPAAPARIVAPAAYAELRQRYAPDGIQYPLPLLTYQEKAGCLLDLPGLGCAAVEHTDGGFSARELLSDDPERAASALCAFLGCASLPARLPGHAPFGMAKSLDGSPLSPSFLGLDFG
ncbi:MAG: GNAT family N-acetyltransferase [Oscillospiraceae bacterium]|nr:GNAT family N-acetyltransferase [Oscillospiraceae bacterium]